MPSRGGRGVDATGFSASALDSPRPALASVLHYGKRMASPARWQRAQRYERGYWESLATRIAAGSASQLDWYRWRADQLVLRLRALGLGALTEGRARVIEVGCGPVGVVGFFPAVERIAIDPLEPYYVTNPTLTSASITFVTRAPR